MQFFLEKLFLQSENVVVTSSKYPNLNTFVRRDDICVTIAKIQVKKVIKMNLCLKFKSLKNGRGFVTHL